MKRKTKISNTRSPDYIKRKASHRRRTNTKNGKIRYRTKTKLYRNPTVQIP